MSPLAFSSRTPDNRKHGVTSGFVRAMA
jgi:hypothetical protein